MATYRPGTHINLKKKEEFDTFTKFSNVKPENVGKTFTPIRDLYSVLPKQPATDWERGTFRQWLERGYHVIKGQKGTLQVWEFKGNAYEAEDGKESDWGRAAAVYFTPDQVEPNQPREAKA